MSGRRLGLIILFIIIAAAILIFFVSPPFNISQKIKPKRVALLTASDVQLSGIDGIKAGLGEQGYVEGKNIAYEIYNPKGDANLIKQMAQNIVASKPDVIVPLSTSASTAIKDADSAAKIPAVAVDVGNFKDLGIDNIQRPGGFMTGVVVDNISAAPKRLEILKTLSPNLKIVGVAADPKHISYNQIVSIYEDGAKRLGLAILWEKASTKDELGEAIKKIVKAGVGAFMTTPQPLITENSAVLTKSLNDAKIPSIDQNIERGVKAGYLMVYGVARYDTGKQGARMISKVLKGENPGEVPVEFASTLSFEINAGLAKTMGIKIPQQLLLQANKVDQ